jgi:hypothetical protein
MRSTDPQWILRCAQNDRKGKSMIWACAGGSKPPMIIASLLRDRLRVSRLLAGVGLCFFTFPRQMFYWFPVFHPNSRQIHESEFF